jgi:hypothetical protein
MVVQEVLGVAVVRAAQGGDATQLSCQSDARLARGD